jgi:hypothetical protein
MLFLFGLVIMEGLVIAGSVSSTVVIASRDTCEMS